MAKRNVLFLTSRAKATFSSLGIAFLPASLFVAYELAKIKYQTVNLNVLELERHQQSYLEYKAPLMDKQSLKKDITEEDDYIKGPRLWRRFRAKKGPKYWARIAKTCGPLPKALAVEVLSKLHDLPDGVYYNTALACDKDTLIALARKPGTDIRFFIPPIKTFDESHHLSFQLYTFLNKLSEDHDLDPHTKYHSQVLLCRIPCITEEGDTVAEDDDEYFEYPTFLNKPRKTELRPPMQSLASLTMHTLDIIRHHTMHEDQRYLFIYQQNGLQLLTRIWYIFKCDELIMRKLAHILVNLSQDKSSHSLLVSGGFLHMLATWMKSSNNELLCTAASVLANLSGEPPTYSHGCYLLNPVYKTMAQPQVDVVFVHGVNGDTFFTWRQNKCSKECDDYTACWPKDWLAEEFGSSVRVIGVNYPSKITYWESHCPDTREKQTINEQAKCLIQKLKNCKLGERPIVWVGHSLGGLIIKQMLMISNEEDLNCSSLLDQTKDVIFIGVPHGGSPVAGITNKTYYLALPTLEMQEVGDFKKLAEMNERFSGLAERKSISCKNFIEGRKTQTSARLKLHIVPKEFSEIKYGENLVLEEEDHISICKPKDRDNDLYKSLTSSIKQLLSSFRKDSQSKGIFPHPLL